MNNVWKVLVILGLIIMAGCTKINSTQTEVANPRGVWGLAIFNNNTEIPQAGFRAMNITAGVLRSRGVRRLVIYPRTPNCNQLIVCPSATPTVREMLRWARSRNLQYVMLGAVNEWDYKVGLDGEPIAGISLQLYCVKTGALIWSSVGSKIGTSRSGLAVVAQKLINEMLSTLQIV